MRRWDAPVPFVAFAELVRGGTGLGGWKGAEFMIVDGEMEGLGSRKTWGAMDLRYKCGVMRPMDRYV